MRSPETTTARFTFTNVTLTRGGPHKETYYAQTNQSGDLTVGTTGQNKDKRLNIDMKYAAPSTTTATKTRATKPSTSQERRND